MFIDSITTFANELAFNDYRDQQVIAANNKGKAAFDVKIKQTVKIKLQELNYSFTDDALFVAFCADRLLAIPITGTETKIICLDAVIENIDGVDKVIDYGTKLVEYYGLGYYVTIPDPSFSVDTIN